MARGWRCVVASFAAGVAAPLGCGLATSGLASPDDVTPHDGGATEDRPGSPDVGAEVNGNTAETATPAHDAGDDSADAARPPDAPADASDAPTLPDVPEPPCPTGVLFCDGFEQGLGAWPTLEQTDGTIGLDTTHVHRGAYAVHAHMNALGQQGGNPSVSIDHTQSWPSHYWVRFFAYAPSPIPPSPSALFNLIQTSGDQGMQLYLTPNAGDVAMTTFDTGNDHTWQSTTPEALDQWACFVVEADMPTGTVNVAVDGADVSSLDMTGFSLPAADLTKLGLGFYNPNTQGPYDAWFDDVIVDDNPVDCSE